MNLQPFTTCVGTSSSRSTSPPGRSRRSVAELVDVDALLDERARSRDERTLADARRRHARQHHDLRLGRDLAYSRKRLQSIHLGHRDVQQENVGLEPLSERDRFSAVARLADDVDRRLESEDDGNELPEARLVVADHDRAGIAVAAHAVTLARFRRPRGPLRSAPRALRLRDRARPVWSVCGTAGDRPRERRRAARARDASADLRGSSARVGLRPRRRNPPASRRADGRACRRRRRGRRGVVVSPVAHRQPPACGGPADAEARLRCRCALGACRPGRDLSSDTTCARRLRYR